MSNKFINLPDTIFIGLDYIQAKTLAENIIRENAGIFIRILVRDTDTTRVESLTDIKYREAVMFASQVVVIRQDGRLKTLKDRFKVDTGLLEIGTMLENLNEHDDYRTVMTRDKILRNRQTWIDHLLNPDTKKTTAKLDRGNGERCCLGHACVALGIPSAVMGDEILYDGTSEVAPESLVRLVGLWGVNGEGSSIGSDKHKSYFDVSKTTSIKDKNIWGLTKLNDDTTATPQEIGAYLQSVIEGGRATPFKPLTDFEEG